MEFRDCLIVCFFVWSVFRVFMSNWNPFRDPLLMFGHQHHSEVNFLRTDLYISKLEWWGFYLGLMQIFETCKIYVQFGRILHKFYKSHTSFEKNLSNLSQTIFWRMRQCVDPIYLITCNLKSVANLSAHYCRVQCRADISNESSPGN